MNSTDGVARLLELIPDARKLESATDTRGDVAFMLDKQTRYLEIKTITERGKKGQVNQVRGIDYLPLVIYKADSDSFLVLPPNDALAILCKKLRGQHGGLALESGVIHYSNDLVTEFKVENDGVGSKIAEALRTGDEHYPRVKNHLLEIRKAISDLEERVKNIPLNSRISTQKLDRYGIRSKSTGGK